MSDILLDCDNKETFFDNKMNIKNKFIINKTKEIIEDKNFLSDYFLTWLFFKNNLSNFSFNINRFNSEISIIQDNEVIYVYNILDLNDKFLNTVTKSLNINELAEIFNFNLPFYGELNIKKVSKLNYTDNATIYITIISLNKGDISEELKGLNFLLSNIDDFNSLNKEEKEILDEKFYIYTNNNISFDSNYKESIKLLNNYIKINEIILI